MVKGNPVSAGMSYLSLTNVVPPRAEVVATVAAAVAAAPGDARTLRVPVYREFIADLETPVSTYLKLRDGATSSFLLETVEGGERLGRYSFVGSDPDDVLRVGDGCALTGDPLTVLEAFLRQSRLVVPAGIKLPEFTGGAVGYVGYDCVRFFEPRTAANLSTQADVLRIPDAVFLIANTVVVFDHVRHTIKIVAHCSVAPAAGAGELEASYAAACESIETVLERLSHPLAAHLRAPAPPGSPVAKAAPTGAAARQAVPAEFDWSAASNMGRAGYEEAVRSLQTHVVSGDIIQAVPSHRVSRELPPGVSAFDVYRQLRVVNPSPYMFFLSLGEDFQVGRGRRRGGSYAPVEVISSTMLPSNLPRRSSGPRPRCSCESITRARALRILSLGRGSVAPTTLKTTPLPLSSSPTRRSEFLPAFPPLI